MATAMTYEYEYMVIPTLAHGAISSGDLREPHLRWLRYVGFHRLDPFLSCPEVIEHPHSLGWLTTVAKAQNL